MQELNYRGFIRHWIADATLVSGGQPVTGTIEGYNPYEILLQTAKGQLLVFKHAIASIEPVDEPKGFTIER